MLLEKADCSPVTSHQIKRRIYQSEALDRLDDGAVGDYVEGLEDVVVG